MYVCVCFVACLTKADKIVAGQVKYQAYAKCVCLCGNNNNCCIYILFAIVFMVMVVTANNKNVKHDCGIVSSSVIQVNHRHDMRLGIIMLLRCHTINAQGQYNNYNTDVRRLTSITTTITTTMLSNKKSQQPQPSHL